MQEKTNDSFVPMRIGGLGKWVAQQRQRKDGKKGSGPALSKAEEDKVRSLHHALSL